MEQKKKTTAFVTYAWGTEEFNDKVVAFVSFLRENGIDATVDRVLMENRTDPNFIQIMNEGLNYDKVIVILSKEYKEKTNRVNTGVNKEYNVIATQRGRAQYSNKYIFVSFQGTTEQDLDEIMPTMYEGIEVLDFSKEEETVKNRLFAKILDAKTIALPKVADHLPEVKVKTPSNFFKKEEKFRLAFTVSADLTTITYDNTTKNNLRKWMTSKSQEFEIVIDNLYITSVQEWVEQKDVDIESGKSLSDDEERQYMWLAKAVDHYKKEDEVTKLAIRVFLEKLSGELDSYCLTVNEYLRIIETIFTKYHLRDQNVRANIDGWCMNAKNDFVFKAEVKDTNYGKMTSDMLYCADARIDDFAREDILYGIIPAFCQYFAIGKTNGYEYEIEKKENWLLWLQFGLA